MKIRKISLRFKINRKIEDSICELADQTEILPAIRNRAGAL